MDPVSIAIVVTVLSVGFVLVYLFKTDYERRQGASYNQTNTKKPKDKQLSHKFHLNKSASLNSKQVPLDNAINNATQNTPHTVTTNSKQSLAKPADYILNGALTSNIKNNEKQQLTLRLNKRKENNEQVSKVKLVDLSHRATIVSPTNDLDPSLDELDSSILIGVFNPSNQKPLLKSAKKCNSPQPQEKKSSHRKRQNSEHSSEQLFNIIATSYLSRDEIELAVEALINKLESGESDWKRPKSDPLQRLKNQLHDNEIALYSEIQNHEQARARINELKSLLQGERSSSNLLKDELVKQRQELSIASLALEQTRGDLAKQQMLNKQLKEDNSQRITKLELEKAQLQMINEANTVVTDNAEFTKLRNDLEDKAGQLQRYELSNQAMGEKLQEYESKLRNTESQLEKARSNKQQDDYEARAQISDLEADRMRLDKALKDHVARLKEVSETNNLLENSVNELQLINSRLEEMLKRLRDERHVNEASMKRTLCEMEQELKELQTKLSANSASHDERLRMEMSQVEKELNNAGRREQKLVSEMEELREGLANLLPDYIRASDLKVRPDDWVHQYLAAVKQLAKTVDEFGELNNCSNNNNNNDIDDSLSKKSVDKSSVHPNGASSRVGSPTNKGRLSKIGNHESDKKVMETKLLELTCYVAELEQDIQKLKEEQRESPANVSVDNAHHDQQIRDLKMQRNKLEAQIKFGLDSLKLEQERVKSLEEQLSKCQPISQSTSPQTIRVQPFL